jgi:hypothetical protein
MDFTLEPNMPQSPVESSLKGAAIFDKVPKVLDLRALNANAWLRRLKL